MEVFETDQVLIAYRYSYFQDGSHDVHICSCVRRLPASSPNACVVIGSLYLL